MNTSLKNWSGLTIMQLMVLGIHLDRAQGEVARKNRIELLDLLLKHNADLNTDQGQGTPLHIAVSCQDMLMIDWLLLNGANANARDIYGLTAMNYAARAGSLAVIKLFHSRGVFMDFRDESGGTPLGAAAEAGRWNCVEFLVHNQASLQTAEDGGNIWHSLAKSGFISEVVTILEEESIKGLCDLPDDRNLTPMMIVLLHNQPQWALYLHKSGAQLNKVARGQVSVAHISAARSPYSDSPVFFRNSMQAFSLLRQCSINFNIVDAYDSTPLMVSAAHGDLVGVFCMLKFGSDPRAKDTQGRTALHYAVAQIKREAPGLAARFAEQQVDKTASRIVSLLLAAGADVIQADQNGLTALMLAFCYDVVNPNIWQQLVNYGANPHLQTVEGFKLCISETSTSRYDLCDPEGRVVREKIGEDYSTAVNNLLRRSYLIGKFPRQVVTGWFMIEEMENALEEAETYIARGFSNIPQMTHTDLTMPTSSSEH